MTIRGPLVRSVACRVAMMVWAAALLGVTGAVAQDNPRARWEFFYRQRAYPFAVIPRGALQAARQGLVDTWPDPFAAAPALRATPWQQIGPERIPSSIVSSGRLTAIAVHPTDPNTIYVGGAQGGVWKTVNGGTTWVPRTDKECSLAIGSIAIDPVDPNIVYAGTGEQHFSQDSYYGCGVLRTVDGGANWIRLEPTAFESATQGGARIARVVVDPGTAGSATSTTVLVASDFGLYRSTNSGSSWTEVLNGTVTDLVMDPTASQVLYAARRTDRISKSTDAGATWSDANNGFAGSNVARVNIAIAPSNSQILFASVQNSTNGQLLGIWKTTDGAASWSQLSATGASCASQCWYDMTLAVHPTNADVVFFGGLSLQRSINGGVLFSGITGSIHVDQHLLVFDPSDPNVLYVGNDGGIYKTIDAAAAGTPPWTTLNTTLSITQFYSGISLHPTDPNIAIGGTQDNRTLGYVGTPDWNQVLFGDGGYTAIDYNDPNTMYAETQWNTAGGFSGPRRSDNGGTSFPLKVNGINTSESALFIPPLVMDPTTPETLYFGTTKVYKTTDRAELWTVISPDFTAGGHVSIIAVSPSDPDVLYVGTSQGRVHRTSDGGANWTEITMGVPARFVRDIAVDYTDPSRAFLVISGFGVSGHVLKTTDGGATWLDASGNLPDVPVNAVLIEPGMPDNIYIGSDLGAFVSTDAGATWSPFNDGLPLVAVFDLVINSTSGLMLAGTHGRGMFSRTVDIALAMTVSPKSRADSIAVGSTIPSVDSADVRFVGPGATTQNWTAVPGGGMWLTVTTPSGSGNGTVRWSRDPTGLALGTYVDTITVTATGSGLSPVSIVDTLAIGEALAMSVNLSSLVDTTVAGAERLIAAAVSLTITGVGSGSTQWSASHGAGGWITVTRASGTGGAAVEWSRDASQLVEGLYIDTITITAPGSGLIPLAVVDTLMVGPAIALSAAAEELFVGGLLSPLQIGFLDALGNDDGTYNLGDVLAWIQWCQGASSGGCIDDVPAGAVSTDGRSLPTVGDPEGAGRGAR